MFPVYWVLLLLQFSKLYNKPLTPWWGFYFSKRDCYAEKKQHQEKQVWQMTKPEQQRCWHGSVSALFSRHNHICKQWCGVYINSKVSPMTMQWVCGKCFPIKREENTYEWVLECEQNKMKNFSHTFGNNLKIGESCLCCCGLNICVFVLLCISRESLRWLVNMTQKRLLL